MQVCWLFVQQNYRMYKSATQQKLHKNTGAGPQNKNMAKPLLQFKQPDKY